MASYFLPIANAVKTLLDAIPGAPTVIVRKESVLHARERDTLGASPICVVSLADERVESWSAMGNGGGDLGTIAKSYTIAITVYRSNATAALSTTLATNPDFLLSAKQALHRVTLSGVPVVWDSQLMEHSEWEEQSFGVGMEASTFAVMYRTAEPRNG